jgi:hypothetical protein
VVINMNISRLITKVHKQNLQTAFNFLRAGRTFKVMFEQQMEFEEMQAGN